MNKRNVNGQNGVATSAVTSVMASAFAAEMDSIFAEASSRKKIFPIMNFLCNVKVGTKRETLHGIKRNMLVTLLAPYGTSTMKGWVYQVDGKVSADSVVWLLESAIDYITKFENHLNAYKAGATNFTQKFIEVVEQYGIADLERRIAEMHQYFADLAGIEIIDAPMLDEQEQDDAAIEYLREVMPTIPVDIISEKIDECVVDLCLDEDGKIMDFDKFCDVLWDDYVWDEVFTDEALESDTREWMEFNDRVRYIIENEKENIFINCYDEIEGKIAPKNDAPILDDDVDRVVNTIEKYLGSYTPSYLDQFGECVITIGWDEFSEKDMQMLIEDDVFEGLVIDSLVGENISDVLVYDDGVYVTVDYDKTFDKSNVLNTLRRECALCEVDEYEMSINALADRCGGYYIDAPIYVMYNKESDTYYVNGLGEDNDFAINDELTSKTTYMELYDMITELLERDDIIEYIYNLDSRPSWVTKDDIKIANSYNGDYLDIVMFGSYHVGLYYDNSERVHDFAKAELGAYGIEDMRYAVEIMENRDYIVSLAEKVLVDCEFNNVA